MEKPKKTSSRYSKKIDNKVKEFVADGFNNRQIAAKLGISKATFYRYVQELKKEGKIESISINNQEFLYSKK